MKINLIILVVLAILCSCTGSTGSKSPIDEYNEVLERVQELEKIYWCPVKLFCVPKIKVGFLAWNPTFFVTFVFVTKPK